jgi:hypothetical protein
MTISIGDLLGQDEFWVFLVVLGVALLNWPMLSLEANRGPLFGFPPLLIYISTVWLILIFFAFLFEKEAL